MQTLAEHMIEEFKDEFMETLGPQIKEEKARETAKNLLNMGIDIDMISKATGLKKTDIEKLAAEI